MAVSADGVLCAVTHSRRLARLMDTRTSTEIASFAPPVTQSIINLRLAHDGSRLAAATANNLVLVWDLRRLREQLQPMRLDW